MADRHALLQTRMARVVASLVLVVLGCVVGALLSEAAFRAYLYVAYPGPFQPISTPPYFGVYNVSHWEFDERFGYVYPPGRKIDYTGIKDGYVYECDRLDVINEHGNIGPIEGRYEDADLKILVFGDSWTAFHRGGRTWPHFLQAELRRRLERNVNVVNFGRDGYGLLQMFDLAGAQIPKWKPNLAIIAFITDDLTRARFWRTVVGEGDEMRVLTTLDPARTPDPERAVDTYLLMPSATFEWCTSMVGTGRTDAVLEKLVAKYRRLRERAGSRPANVLSLTESYLYNRLMTGNAFTSLVRGLPLTANPRVSFTSYASDQRFMTALDQIRSAGVPIVLFHLAYYPEIRAGEEYILNSQEAALLTSLEQVTGLTVLRTTDYVGMPVDRPERLNAGPNDYHPSLWGMDFYAKAVAEGLIRNRLVR